MAKLRTSAAGLVSRLCAVLLGFLGFACSSEDGPDDPGMSFMYGTPTGEFEIKGAVTDEAGKAIGDADVRVTMPDVDSNPWSITNGLTGTDGKFSLDGSSVPVERLKVVCVPHGDTFEPDSTLVELKYVKDKNDKGAWSRGKAEAEVNFKLKKKGGE